MPNAAGGLPTDARPIAFGTVFLAAHHLDRLGDVVLAPLGLTTKQWLLLAVLARGFEGHAPSLSEAAALYGSSRQNVKAIARGLAARGYLRLVPDPGDRRVLHLLVTPKTSVFSGPDWAAREAAFFAFAFGSLDPAGVEALAGLLQRWLAAVAPAPPQADLVSVPPGRTEGDPMTRINRPLHAVLVGLVAVFAAVASLAGIALRGDLATTPHTTLRGEQIEVVSGGIYRWNSLPVVSEGVGWDLVTLLLVVPALLLVLRGVGRGSLRATLAAIGLLAYCLYQYAEYAMFWAIGPLFPLHVATFALSLSAIGVLVRASTSGASRPGSRRRSRGARWSGSASSWSWSSAGSGCRPSPAC